ncbi:MAG: ATP-binding protein [Alphaproteobacteria bacterium]
MAAETAVTVTNNLEELNRATSAVSAFCSEHSELLPLEHRLTLVLEELLTNTISYGYDAADTMPHVIEVRLSLADGWLHVTCEDDGAPFDLTRQSEADMSGDVEDRPIGGLGIHLIMTIMDSVTYQRTGDRNRVDMRLALSD